MVSCSSRKPPEPVRIETTRTVTEVVKDTIYKVAADSTFYQAWIECQNGKPVLKEPETVSQEPGAKNREPGNGKALQTPKVTLKGNQLQVECYQRAQELFKTWKEKYTAEHQTTTVPAYIEKPFRWYHKALMYTGTVSLLLLAIGLLARFIKPS